jgi:hypothetical protein
LKNEARRLEAAQNALNVQGNGRKRRKRGGARGKSNKPLDAEALTIAKDGILAGDSMATIRGRFIHAPLRAGEQSHPFYSIDRMTLYYRTALQQLFDEGRITAGQMGNLLLENHF